MKIAVIGTGRVGLPFALSFVEAGLEVIGIDIDPRLRKSINEDRVMPFHEPGYDALVRTGRLLIVDDYEQIPSRDYIIITVGTPLHQHIETDLKSITNVTVGIAEYLRKGQTILLRSTVAPKTTDYVKNLIEKKTGLKVGRDIFLAFCPERIVEGKAKEELVKLPQIVGSEDPQSAAAAEKLFKHLGIEVLHSSYTAAELTKLFNNVSRYVYFAMSNYLAMVAAEYGEEFYQIANMANYKYPRPIHALPGFTAGTCLRKDFGMLAESHLDGDMLLNAWRINESMPKFLVEEAIKRWGELRDKQIAILGYTFKRDTDDIRDSLVPKLARYLLRENPRKILVSDPFITENDIEKLVDTTFVSSYAEAVEQADLILIATNHTIYTTDREKILDRISDGNSKIVDLWNSLMTGKIFIDVR